ncbi:MAG: ABC transporter ATP-binding protein [Gammaproteobacteria bacterium]
MSRRRSGDSATGSSDGAWRAGNVLAYTAQALRLVWQTNRRLAIALGILTVTAGALPAVVAWVGQLIIDAVVAALELPSGGRGEALNRVYYLVGLEALVVAGLSAAQRGITTCQSLLRAQLGHRVNAMILEKALTLGLKDFEDDEFYDKLTRARREASTRPLSLVTRSFGLVQNSISLASFAVLLVQFSPWTVVILALAGLPAFLAEAKFSGDAFRLFRWRSPETRKQMYLETVLAREDYAKEVKLFGLGPLLLNRYREIFRKLYREDRALTLRRDAWGLGLGLLGTFVFYGAYAWIAATAVAGGITLGQMTMYLLVFKQGQSAVAAILSAIGGMYEDNLYLSNLYEYLEQPVDTPAGERRIGPDPADGIRFEDVGFTYPGAARAALSGVSFHLQPGSSLAVVGENGSGKTTLIKLLSRLYEPTEGRITLDGLDLRQWDPQALAGRIAVIFQDFARYQFLLGENIGAGDVAHFESEDRWATAAGKGLATDFIHQLPEGYETQLGRWFKDGQELSGGQWQKVALSRAFMRQDADILVLDEPTAAMDAAAEAQVFEHFRSMASDRMVILISHRFSTVRKADQILVLSDGRVVERGDHGSLLAADGIYAHLFELQAAGYR